MLPIKPLFFVFFKPLNYFYKSTNVWSAERSVYAALTA